MVNREDLAVRSAGVRRYALVVLDAEDSCVLAEPVVRRCIARSRQRLRERIVMLSLKQMQFSPAFDCFTVDTKVEQTHQSDGQIERCDGCRYGH